MRKIERLSWRYKEGLTRYILPIHDKATINGVTYGRAIMYCPDCFERGLSTTFYRWKHGDNHCDGNLYVGDNAHLLCGKCGQHIPILESSFLCPVQSKTEDAWVYFNNQSQNKEAISPTDGKTIFACLISTSDPLVSMGAEWLKKCFASLESL